MGAGPERMELGPSEARPPGAFTATDQIKPRAPNRIGRFPREIMRGRLVTPNEMRATLSELFYT